MFVPNNLIGLDVEYAMLLAESNNWIVRVMEKDGRGLIGTCDFDDFRINVSVKDGKIASILDIG